MEHIFQKLNIRGPSRIYEIVGNTFQIKDFVVMSYPVCSTVANYKTTAL
jgi:hypothetical protein